MRKTIFTLVFAIFLQIPLQFHSTASKVTEAGGSSGIKVPATTTIKPLPSVQFDAIAELAPIEVAVAAPVPANPVSQNGCVTGYVSGDYYLDKIISYESSGNSCATNPGGCFGLLQACPGEPLRAACGGDPACQIEWFRANKTGGRSWAQVWQHELDYGWW
jgi:hypothetical protein